MISRAAAGGKAGAGSIPRICATGFAAKADPGGYWCSSASLRCAPNYAVTNATHTSGPAKGYAVLRYVCKPRR